VDLYGLSLTGLRFFTVYGPWGRPDMATWLFTDAMLKGQPIRWPMKLGGTLISPRITDSGVDELVKGSVTDAVKGEAKDRATQEANKLLEKEGAKNPEIKQKATDLLKGLGR